MWNASFRICESLCPVSPTSLEICVVYEVYKILRWGEKWPLPWDIQKQKSFQLQGGFAPLTPRPGALPLDPAGGSAPRPPSVPPAPNLPLHHCSSGHGIIRNLRKLAIDVLIAFSCSSSHVIRSAVFSCSSVADWDDYLHNIMTFNMTPLLS